MKMRNGVKLMEKELEKMPKEKKRKLNEKISEKTIFLK